MNCKPHDLAIVIDDVTGLMSDGPFEGQWATVPLSGKVVRVVAVRFALPDGAIWLLDEPLRLNYEHNGQPMRGRLHELPDSILRPLPTLSDDEHDQAEAGKPEQVAA